MKLKQPDFLLSIALVSIIFFALLGFLPRSWVTKSADAYHIKSIYIFNPYLYHIIFVGSGLLAMVMLPYISKKKLPLHYKLSLLALPLLVYPASCTMSVFSNLGYWTTHGVVSTPDGATYRFLDSSFLQGQLMAIAKRSNHNPLIHKFDVLVMNNGDYPRSFSRIIRHQDGKDIYGQLYYTADGYLIGVRHQNKSYLAYNVFTNKAYGHDAVEQLSPFILLDADSKLNIDDVNSIIEAGMGNMPGEPRADAVKDGLKHPNQHVRKIAKQLLEKVKPEAKNKAPPDTLN